ncbi:MAG: hypothetical protein K0U93_24065 [Gammaproteobacteria bacterium]|nr:hypothetical protein [Gammaproteobacteria bacterium]
MSDLSTFNEMVLNRVPDVESIMDSTARDEAVRAAVETYSRHRPRMIVVDVNGSGATDIPLPAEWIEDYSALREVEYPVGEKRPCTLETEDYQIYQTPLAEVLRLYHHTPGVTDNIRLSITVYHDVDDTTSTIPAAHENALGDLAASVLCERLSTHFSTTTDSTLATDSVDHQSQSRDYAMRAKCYRQLALSHLGISTRSRANGSVEQVAQPASAARSYAPNTGHGFGRLTH